VSPAQFLPGAARVPLSGVCAALYIVRVVGGFFGAGDVGVRSDMTGAAGRALTEKRSSCRLKI
jgi:hypothetical protein